eukprot:8976946-Prorocentrum_lima.AAC.1
MPQQLLLPEGCITRSMGRWELIGLCCSFGLSCLEDWDASLVLDACWTTHRVLFTMKHTP